MGVLWTLCEREHATFRELQHLCESISPSVLNTRIKEHREAKLIEVTDQGYAATDLGRELYAQLKPMGIWSKRWAKVLAENNGNSS